MTVFMYKWRKQTLFRTVLVDDPDFRAGAIRILHQNGLFVSFPYVCPEPVLVKSSF
eukprot:COSAG06_NODE_1003_length_11130_cov_5.230804_6_plen_56_part_00